MPDVWTCCLRKELSNDETPVLPWPLAGQLLGDVQRALHAHVDGQLRQLLAALKDGSLTFERAVCGLGHIEGHYAVLRELARFQQDREERFGGMISPQGA